jgi:hypothetical protein
MDFGARVVCDRPSSVIKSENDVKEMHMAKGRVYLASSAVWKTWVYVTALTIVNRALTMPGAPLQIKISFRVTQPRKNYWPSYIVSCKGNSTVEPVGNSLC